MSTRRRSPPTANDDFPPPPPTADPPTPPSPTHYPIAHWRCCLCLTPNEVTRDLTQPPSSTTTTAPYFHPARCALCGNPPCADCLLSRPVVYDPISRIHLSPSVFLGWNPHSEGDACGFVCMHCGTPTVLGPRDWAWHEWARKRFGESVPLVARTHERIEVAATTGVAVGKIERAPVAGEEVLFTTLTPMTVARPPRERVVGEAPRFLPFERKRRVGVAEVLRLVARCGNEACGQVMADESLEFYVPLGRDVPKGKDGYFGSWTYPSWFGA